MISRLLTAQLGPSSVGPLVRYFSPVPSAPMIPIRRPSAPRRVKAIHLPSGLQSGEAYQPPPKLRRRWFDPSEFITYSCCDPPRSLSNTILDPSGEKLGSVSIPGEVVRRRAIPPSRPVMYMSALGPFIIEKTIRVPSGEKRGAKLIESLATA